MKEYIRNRKGQKIAAKVEIANPQHGLVFVMHGLGGFKEQPHLIAAGEAFADHGFTVVYFDTTNSVGKSDGLMELATTTNYFEDLEDVIVWSATQAWYQEPFALCGHSLGGMCITLYAEKNPSKVLMLAPLSPVVSGTLSVEAHKKHDPQKFEQWQKLGFKIEMSNSKPGLEKKLLWQHIEDRINYDTLPRVQKLSMPVLLLVGERDTSTPPEHVRQLYDALPGPKEFHLLKDAPHTFRTEKDLRDIRQIISSWIRKITH